MCLEDNVSEDDVRETYLSARAPQHMHLNRCEENSEDDVGDHEMHLSTCEEDNMKEYDVGDGEKKKTKMR